DRDFLALRPRFGDVLGPEQAPHRHELDEIVELVLEIGRAQPYPLLQEILVDAGLPALAPLGFQIGVGEAGKEQVVDGGRAEAFTPGSPDTRVGLGDEDDETGPASGGAPEDGVVVVTMAGRHDDAVEEPELVLEVIGEVVDLLREPAGGPGTIEAGR